MPASSTGDTQLPRGPKRRERHYYDESVDEPAQLLEDEPVDVEDAIPAEPVEAIEDAEEGPSPVFDEGAPSRDERRE